MRPELDGWMARQHGLVTRRQVIESGVEARHLDRWVRQGSWVTVRCGVYAESDVVREAARSRRQRRLLGDRAASLRIAAPHVPSHDFAANLMALPFLDPRVEHTHVTRPGIVGSHLRHGVKHHLAPYALRQLTSVEGEPVLGLARTAVDLAREHGLEAGVVAIDGARHAGVELPDLWAVIAQMRSWPHITTVREALELSDGDADTPHESMSRLLVTSLGFGRPVTQFGLTRGGRTVWVDLILGRHVFEADGWAKYVAWADGGYAVGDPVEVLREEKARQDFIQSFRLGVSHIMWEDHFGGRRTALARLRHEYLQTCALFGTSRADLHQFRPRGRRPRARLRTA